MQEQTRLLRDEIADGFDELGVLLMGHAKGAYWYGSQLTIQEARQLCPHNNATSLQVNAPALGAVIWAMRNPNAGIVEPDDIDFRTVLDVAIALPRPGGRRLQRLDAARQDRGKLLPGGRGLRTIPGSSRISW